MPVLYSMYLGDIQRRTRWHRAIRLMALEICEKNWRQRKTLSIGSSLHRGDVQTHEGIPQNRMVSLSLMFLFPCPKSKVAIDLTTGPIPKAPTTLYHYKSYCYTVKIPVFKFKIIQAAHHSLVSIWTYNLHFSFSQNKPHLTTHNLHFAKLAKTIVIVHYRIRQRAAIFLWEYRSEGKALSGWRKI